MAEWLPKEGDRLFVETEQGAFLDPLGLSDPLQPEARSMTGRRDLYSRGYLDAADRIVDSLIGAAHEDMLIYPIFFLCRHHLELELKMLIESNLRQVGQLDASAIKWLSQKHGLAGLWDRLKTSYPDYAGCFPATTTEAFQELLMELDPHDSNGQAGWYESDSTGRPRCPV